MINSAQLSDFNPLIYIINKEKINDSRLIKVPIKDAANPLSTEYQIYDLIADEFEFIKIKSY